MALVDIYKRDAGELDGYAKKSGKDVPCWTYFVSSFIGLIKPT
jgi:hypothetical protein